MDKNLVLSLVLAAIWTIPWKGVALWKAARRGEKIWFIILLVVGLEVEGERQVHERVGSTTRGPRFAVPGRDLCDSSRMVGCPDLCASRLCARR